MPEDPIYWFECHNGHEFRGTMAELFLKPCQFCSQDLDKQPFRRGDLVRVGGHDQGLPFVVVAETDGGYIVGKRHDLRPGSVWWRRGTEFFARKEAIRAV
jgi:hypothetical protein